MKKMLFDFEIKRLEELLSLCKRVELPIQFSIVRDRGGILFHFQREWNEFRTDHLYVPVDIEMDYLIEILKPFYQFDLNTLKP